MTKRIAVVIAAQHYIVHGGIGQFVKGFHDLAKEHDCIVDIITDVDPKTPFFENNGAIIYPSKPTSLRGHRAAFPFKDSIRLETSINLRDAILKACSRFIYDMFIIQSPEGLLAIEILGLQKKIPVVFYTHMENLIYPNMASKTFSVPCLELTRQMMKLPDIIVGTQSKANDTALAEISIPSTVLPMAIPEALLLEPWKGKKEGLLFIGRWEERKNPEAFIEVAKAAGLPVKVMTSADHVDAVRADLEKAGIMDADIRGGISGKEKADFIRSSEFNFVPSHRESFCFALFEGLGHCHSIVLEQNNWWGHYRREDLNIARDTADVLEIIKAKKGKKIPKNQMEFVHDYQNSVWEAWLAVLDKEFEPRDSTGSSFYKEAATGGFYMEEYIDGLNRKNGVGLDDIIVGYSSFDNTHRVQVHNGTWVYVREEDATPREITDLSDLFDM